jgi:hypothetical protein
MFLQVCLTQRLEFLGDAVLDHLFTVYFYNQYPECTPALLTDLRSASVNNYCYAHAAVKAGLNKHILHSSSELHRKMACYLEKFVQSFTGPSHGWEAGIGLPKVCVLYFFDDFDPYFYTQFHTFLAFLYSFTRPLKRLILNLG